MTSHTTVKRHLSTTMLIALAVVALLVAAVALAVVVNSGSDSESRAVNVTADTAPAVLTLKALCARGDQLSTDLTALGACGEKIDKASAAVQGQPQPAAVAGIGRDDVVSIVQAQLAGKVVTSSQVLDLVTQVYNANRPADGKDGPAPTSDQVLAAVQAVCANDRCVGAAGKDAPAATPGQILDEVQAYCGDPGQPCKGPKGDTGLTGNTGSQGAQGISETGQAFVLDGNGACVSRTTYFDPSDGSTLTKDSPAGAAACPVAAPPS